AGSTGRSMAPESGKSIGPVEGPVRPVGLVGGRRLIVNRLSSPGCRGAAGAPGAGSVASGRRGPGGAGRCSGAAGRPGAPRAWAAGSSAAGGVQGSSGRGGTGADVVVAGRDCPPGSDAEPAAGEPLAAAGRSGPATRSRRDGAFAGRGVG